MTFSIDFWPRQGPKNQFQIQPCSPKASPNSPKDPSGAHPGPQGPKWLDFGSQQGFKRQLHISPEAPTPSPNSPKDPSGAHPGSVLDPNRSSKNSS